jgi:hypothetical protein
MRWVANPLRAISFLTIIDLLIAFGQWDQQVYVSCSACYCGVIDISRSRGLNLIDEVAALVTAA